MEAYHNRGQRERNEFGSWRSERWSWRITLPMLCYRLTRLVVYGLCVCITKIERERERESSVLACMHSAQRHWWCAFHFSVVKRPNGFGQDRRDLLKFGSWIMFPCKSPAQTLYPPPQQQQQQQQQEARGRAFFGKSV